MLKMSKDHRSVGIWWSLLLSGGSLGSHGNFLGLFSSSFVFLMISCHFWSCDRRFCGSVYHDHWAMKSFSHGRLCWSLGEDNEQCCIWLICCLPCLFHHFTFPSWCYRRRSSGGIYGRLLHNEKNQTSLAIMMLWAPWWKEGEKRVTWVSSFPHFLEFS